MPNDDNDTWLQPAFAEMYRVLARDSFAVSFYGWPHADRFLHAYRAAGFRVVGHFVCPKRYTSSTRFVRNQHECAYLLAKGHPKRPQKPLSALLPLVETFSPPGGSVLDPFAGSGSSLVVAQRLGQSYLGIELDGDYHAIACRRLTSDQYRK